jgi:hypothetical protein
MTSSKYRSRQIANSLIAFSMSYERDNLLTRGLGLEHLRELVVRLARPLLRQGASLAYGGSWEDREDNLTLELLRLISAEQEDNSAGGPDSNLPIGKLYNHLPWPHYLRVTPAIEARWIRSCRIIRIDQASAGLSESEIVPDGDADQKTPRVMFNRAVVLSAMRRATMKGMALDIPDASTEAVPPVVARILLGGKLETYSGFLPGIFEEAMVTMAQRKPTYILGGFGGAAETLAKAILDGTTTRPPELTPDWHRKRNKHLDELLSGSASFRMPDGALGTDRSFDELFAFIQSARTDLSGTLYTGLPEAETRELLETRNVATAVRLVRQGLTATNKLMPLPG